MAKHFKWASKLSAHAKSWRQTERNQHKKFEYDEKIILISGLSEQVTSDDLWNHLKQITGIDVERVVMIGQRRAFVELSKIPSDFNSLSWPELDEMKLTVERVNACVSIIVGNLPPDITKDVILSYFEESRCSGGSEVKEIKLFKESHQAVVDFGNAQAADSVAGKRHYIKGSPVVVEKYFPQIDSMPAGHRSCLTDTTFLNSFGQREKDIISEFIVNSGYANELKTKLVQLKDDVDWDPSGEASRIWQISGKNFLSQWADSYQAVVFEFLARLVAFEFPIESVIADTIGNSLPRLTQNLPKEQALLKLDPKNNELLVACFKNEKEKVFQTVSEFVEVIKSEVYKKETLDIVNRERLLLLTKIKFFENVRRQNSGVEVTLDEEKCELHLEGHPEEVARAKSEYLCVLENFVDETYTLPYTNIGRLVKSKEGQEYLSERMVQENISALFVPHKGNAVHVFAVNSTELEKARKCLHDSMKRFALQLEPENRFVIKGEKWERLYAKLNQQQLLEISVDLSSCSVVLLGISEAVVGAKQEVESFMEVEKLRSECQKLHFGLVRFLEEQLWDRVKEIEEQLKEHHVCIKVFKSSKDLQLKGTREGLYKCRQRLQELYNSFVSADKEFTSPGISKLFFGENGQRRLKQIETQKKVVIELIKTSTKRGRLVREKAKEHEKREADMRKREDCEELEVDFVDSNVRCTKSAYDQCNFSTRSGLKVSIKFGNIADEKADILVNTANSNLKQLTTCGEVLKVVGGPSFVEACSSFVSLSKGDVVITTGGDLACKRVVHAVCCSWDNGRGNAEKLLRCLIRRVLERCVHLDASTVAMPTIGTPDHDFPEELVLKVLKEEIEKFSSVKPFTIKEIQILVRAEETACQTSAAGFRTISFGSVNISVHQGDITRHPADAIINVLPSDLRLANGGSVCKRILQAGGKDVQKQLNATAEQCPGPVLVTEAGSMENILWILHFLPPSTHHRDLQKSIEHCFIKAKSKSLTSVSIAAIGTSHFRITPRESVKLILSAAKNFSKTAYPLDVDIVVFQKRMIPDFEAGIQEKARESIAIKTSLPTESRIPKQQSQPICFRSPNTNTIQSITLHVFAHSQGDIDKSLNDVHRFIEYHTGTKTIEIKKVCHLLMKHFSEVETLEKAYGVSITCQPTSLVIVSGLLWAVEVCVTELLSLVEKYGGEESVKSARTWTSDEQTCIQSSEMPRGNDEAFHCKKNEVEQCHFDWCKERDSSAVEGLLQPLHIEQLSADISMKWHRLARLLELPEKTIRDIQCNFDSFPDARSKAARILEIFNLPRDNYRSDSALHDLINCLHEIDVKLPKGFSLPLLDPHLSNTYGASLRDSMFIGDVLSHTRCDELHESTSNVDGGLFSKQEIFTNTTPLSQREIERISREMPESWRPLANLLNIPHGEVENISCNLQYFNPTDKAVEILHLYNNRPSFSRTELGEFFHELHHSELREKVISGSLRKRNLPNAEDEQEIRFKSEKATRHLGERISELPFYWDPQPQGKKFHVVPLTDSSDEYKKVLSHFSDRGGKGRLVKIERIQNPGLHLLYLARKQSMNGLENEMLLFHGTSGDNVLLINANNFNRNYAGYNGETYGRGVYFARDASYSVRYSPPAENGQRCMYVAKVLVGKYTTGKRAMQMPPSRNDPHNPGALYDSVVDNVVNPSVFVIFVDHQYYPEYLITFRS